jgi:DNA-binding MarR family transcriptional regulator
MSEVRWLTPREQEAWRGLMTMNAQVMGRLRRSLQQTSGLSDSDYEVLVPLSEAPGGRLRSYELGAALQWEKSRLSHHLRRMEARGLVDREGCETDRRGAFVVLTPEGRAGIEGAAPDHVEEVRRSFLDALSAEQIDALAGITRAVLAHLDAEPAGAAEPAGTAKSVQME